MTRRSASADRAIALTPGYAEAALNRGLVLGNQGKMQEAEQMLRKALALRPGFSLALYNLSQIRRYEDAGDADAETIRMLLGRKETSEADREQLNFALGKMYDDCGLYDEAFECFGRPMLSGTQWCLTTLTPSPG